jgi:hypothetical protein
MTVRKNETNSLHCGSSSVQLKLELWLNRITPKALDNLARRTTPGNESVRVHTLKGFANFIVEIVIQRFQRSDE